jgi:hypothetical protein
MNLAGMSGTPSRKYRRQRLGKKIPEHQGEKMSRESHSE